MSKDDGVVVPADKASNNIVFVCKTHYINCLMEELNMSTMTGNPTYNLTAMSKDDGWMHILFRDAQP